MNTPPYGEAMFIGMSGYGVKFEKQYETQEELTLYISVPEHSCYNDVHGEEMAGKHLAFRFKKTLEAMGMKRFKVLSKTRKDEYWTKEDREKAELECKKMLYGSQY